MSRSDTLEADALEAHDRLASEEGTAPEGNEQIHNWPPATGFGAGGWGPWRPPPQWTPPPPPRPRAKRFRALAIGLAALALVAASATVGLVVGRHQTPSTAASFSPTNPGSGSTGASSGNYVNASEIAAKVDPGLVDINTELAYQDEAAAGTGMVLTSGGLVLTNNHVVEGATSIAVTDIGNGRTYEAKVVGTDVTADVAVIQLTGASGLATVSIGDSFTLAVGDAVVAIGNAGGVGGTPSVSSGNITALNQSITASDEGSDSSEQLTGLIETSATLQAGDSGGPLVDSSGQVVGMDTAASSSGGFQIESGSNQNFAIPINTALSIAKQIEEGHASETVHIGESGFLGVEVESADNAGSSASGAVVAEVISGSPAEQAGLAPGDVIDSLGGTTIDSPDTLSAVMSSHHPGDEVQIGWTDTSGQQHHATVTLGTGPTA